MILRIAISLAVVFAAFSAEDAWKKVKELKSGSELKIYKRGVSHPISAVFDEANDERILVVIKSEQTAMAKESIDRIDARPPRSGPRVTKESQVTSDVDNKASPSRGPKAGGPTSTSSGTKFSINTRPDFEVVYRRAPG